jgi:gluconate kinase
MNSERGGSTPEQPSRPKGPFVIVSDLPASGKSTAATAVAVALGLPLLDKDDILEPLFEGLGIGDSDWRMRLSRAADLVLHKMALRSNGAVIVSWWRHPRSELDSGTSTDWLRSLPGELIELHCRCSPQLAVDRFFGRIRHTGHLDDLKSHVEELDKFERYAAHGPLRLGSLVEVDTGQPLELNALTRRITSTGET